MGYSFLTRKRWEQNPKGEGKYRLYSCIPIIVISNIISYFVYDEILPIYCDLIVLGWGIVGYFVGILLDRLKN